MTTRCLQMGRMRPSQGKAVRTVKTFASSLSCDCGGRSYLLFSLAARGLSLQGGRLGLGGSRLPRAFERASHQAVWAETY